MSDLELKKEWNFRFNERIALLCEDRNPTPDEINQARREANAVIMELAAQTDTDKLDPV